MQTWETFLSKKKIVALDFWDTQTKLLDIFVRRDKWWPLGPRNLLRIGCLTNLGTEDGASDWISTRNDLEEQLDCIRVDPDGSSLPRHGYLEVGDLPDLSGSVSSTSRFVLSASAIAGVNLHSKSVLSFNVRNVTYEKLGQDSLITLLAGEGDQLPNWKPNLSRIALLTTGKKIRKGQEVVLLIATEVVYADKIVFNVSDGRGIGGDVNLAAAGIPVSVGVTAERLSADSFAVTGRNCRIPIGLKAVSLTYIDSVLKRCLPTTASSVRRDSEDDDYLQNPDKYFLHHMGDFFVPDSPEVTLECLPFEDVDTNRPVEDANTDESA